MNRTTPHRFDPTRSKELESSTCGIIPAAVPGGASEPRSKRQRKTKPPGKSSRQPRPRPTAEEALSRAVSNQSLANYPQIFAGFEAKGIAAAEIKPRENVFTFDAWVALGRRVRKGEHGVKIFTFITTEKEKKDAVTGEVSLSMNKRPWTTTVFHITQTDPEGSLRARPAPSVASQETGSLAVPSPATPVPALSDAGGTISNIIPLPEQVIARPSWRDRYRHRTSIG